MESVPDEEGSQAEAYPSFDFAEDEEQIDEISLEEAPEPADELDLGDDYPDETHRPAPSETAAEAGAEEGRSSDDVLSDDQTSDDVLSDDQTSDDELSGDESGLDELAEMDIDSELADIEELSDESEEDSEYDLVEQISHIDLDLEDEEEPVSAAGPESTGGDAPREQITGEREDLPGDIKEEIKSVLGYMDQLLESLPEEKIQEFARSEHFEVYRRLFEELGLTQ
jgi:hypothetical protein